MDVGSNLFGEMTHVDVDEGADVVLCLRLFLIHLIRRHLLGGLPYRPFEIGVEHPCFLQMSEEQRLLHPEEIPDIPLLAQVSGEFVEELPVGQVIPVVERGEIEVEGFLLR